MKYIFVSFSSIKKNWFFEDLYFFPEQESNLARWTQSPTLYHVAIKAGLYRKPVQVCYIPIPGVILPLQIEIRPWISRSPRITWNETKGVLCTHVGYLRWAPNLQMKKMEITFSPERGSNPVRWTQSPALYHVAIKAGLYRKAVQVCYIPIPGDTLPVVHFIYLEYVTCNCPLSNRNGPKWRQLFCPVTFSDLVVLNYANHRGVARTAKYDFIVMEMSVKTTTTTTTKNCISDQVIKNVEIVE